MLMAIIPARGGSKRFPRKNIALLDGRPLLHYAVEAAKKAAIFDRIVVSTDDKEIAGIAEGLGAEVLMRDAELGSDDATVPQVCIDVISKYEKKGVEVGNICILLPTSPLRAGDDIRKAFELFESSGADYLMSITDYRYSPFRALKKTGDGFLNPLYGSEYLTQDQKNPKVFVHDGSIIFARAAQLRKDRTYYGERIVGYYIPPKRTVDINEPFDLELAEYLIRRRK